MRLFNINNPTPVAVCNNAKINHTTFDGVYYYYTLNCEHTIVKTHSTCNNEISIRTCRIYDCIVYDITEECFWATSKNSYTTIFKLDCNMNEIDSIFIDTRGCITGNISGISYNCQCNSIYVTYPTYVLEVFKDGKYIIKYQNCNAYITSVFSLSPYYYITLISNNHQYVYGFNNANTLVYEEKLCPNYVIKSIIFTPISESSEWYFNIFALKNDCYAFSEKIQVTANTLGFMPVSCNFDIATSDGCTPSTSCDPIADFVESIALIEASLAHILNAEGEKIQYAVAQETDMDTILCVNKSVTKTIVQVTHLEQVLHGILETLSEQGICFDSSCCVTH